MSDIDLINNGGDDNSELEEMLKPEDVLKAYSGFSLDFEDEPRDINKEHWFTAEDYGNYDGWIQCRFAEKFIETHRQYTLPKYRYIEDENGDYYVVCD